MRFAIYNSPVASSTAGTLTLGLVLALAQVTNCVAYTIDLPTALRLAGAQNLDVQIARRRLQEAQANRQSAIEQFFPWISPGVTYHRRDGMAQAVPAGTISRTHFQSYAPGATVSAQMELGDAIYKSLAAKHLVKASGQALEAQRQDSILRAAQGYFDLAKAKALVGVNREALETSRSYQRQLHAAVADGIAFKGDELRVQTQTGRYQIALRKALEQQRIAAVNLARILDLDPTLELVPKAAEGLSPMTLVAPNAPLDALVQHALRFRPELQQSLALVAAARDAKNSAVYGPLIPSLGAQVFAGDLGGRHDGQPDTFGSSKDYLVGLGWRIGPGGLLDFGRINASRANLATAQLGEAKLKNIIVAQVVDNLTRIQSLSDQITLAMNNLNTASETLRLTRERKQFGVGEVLENIQAQQELARARADYLNSVAEFNQAQYELAKTVGYLAETGRNEAKPEDERDDPPGATGAFRNAP